MTMITLIRNEQPASSGYRVDVSRGERVGRVVFGVVLPSR